MTDLVDITYLIVAYSDPNPNSSLMAQRNLLLMPKRVFPTANNQLNIPETVN